MTNFQINSFDEYQKQYLQSITDPERFWDNIAEHFLWTKKWSQTLNWNFEEPKIEWFKDGKLNITENIFERNLPELKNQIAYFWEPNDPSSKEKSITYQELFIEVQKMR